MCTHTCTCRLKYIWVSWSLFYKTETILCIFFFTLLASFSNPSCKSLQGNQPSSGSVFFMALVIPISHLDLSASLKYWQSLNTPDWALSLCICPSCSLNIKGLLFCSPRGYPFICQDSAHGKPLLVINWHWRTDLALPLLLVFKFPWTDCYLRISTLWSHLLMSVSLN